MKIYTPNFQTRNFFKRQSMHLTANWYLFTYLSLDYNYQKVKDYLDTSHQTTYFALNLCKLYCNLFRTSVCLKSQGRSSGENGIVMGPHKQKNYLLRIKELWRLWVRGRVKSKYQDYKGIQFNLGTHWANLRSLGRWN